MGRLKEKLNEMLIRVFVPDLVTVKLTSCARIESIPMTGGCTPPFPPVVKMNKPTGSSTSAQIMEGLKKELNEMVEGVVLPEMSGVNEQYIYKVPPSIRQTNPQAYTPQIISIGPFHNSRGSSSDNNILHQMEELKLKYLKRFLNRTTLSVDDFVSIFQDCESGIRSCYAGHFSFNSDEFLKIIIIDACFIIELFLGSYLKDEGEIWTKDDPILSKPWLFASIKRDLLLLENQLPFFVLEGIYKLALNPDHVFPSFITITINYFKEFVEEFVDYINSERAECPKHFTDLQRTFLLLSPYNFGRQGKVVEHLYSASQLSEAGLVFEVSESKCLLDLEFDKGVLKMPCFRVYDETETLMRNILAFEECHIPGGGCITQYLTILDFLINTEKDVSILVGKGIIVNRMGDDNAVATMVNNLCKNVSMPGFNSKYRSLCKDLNRFYDNPWNKYKAIFVHAYFNTPWKIASTITAVLLVLFTFIQTVCSIWSLFLEK